MEAGLIEAGLAVRPALSTAVIPSDGICRLSDRRFLSPRKGFLKGIKLAAQCRHRVG